MSSSSSSVNSIHSCSCGADLICVSLMFFNCFTPDEARENLTTSDIKEDNLDIDDADDSEPSYVTLEGGLKIPQVIFKRLEYSGYGNFIAKEQVELLGMKWVLWKREAHKWYPSFRVEILHDSAQVPANRKRKAESDESDYETEGSLDSDHERASMKTTNKWDSLISHVLRSESGLLITTYEQLRLLSEKLLDIEWGYAVLDEGHRI